MSMEKAIPSGLSNKITAIFIGTLQNVTGESHYLLASQTVELTAPFAFLMHKAS